MLSLAQEGNIDTSFIGLDLTPVAAKTSQNNPPPEFFLSNKFNSDHQQKADLNCKLGVHTAPNQTGKKNYAFYWGYKNFVLVDCISDLPIYKMTTTVNVSDSTVALYIPADTHSFFPVTECTFLADKDMMSKIYTIRWKNSMLRNVSFLSINVISKIQSSFLKEILSVKLDLPCRRLENFLAKSAHQKFCCPLKSSQNSDCPFHHKNFCNGKIHRDCTKCVTTPDDLRLFVGRNVLGQGLKCLLQI